MGDSAAEKEAVKNAYSSQKWRDRVDKMSPKQITAVYIRLRAQGKLGR